jgi:hypothetical protein
MSSYFREFTKEERIKYNAALMKMAIKKEKKVLEYTGFDLVAQRYIRMGGQSLIFVKAMPNNNILGAVNKVQLPSGEYMYNLEPGAYKVEFTDALPFKWQLPVFHYLQQNRLVDAGMHLTLNFNPFCGILNVEYKALIEDGTTLATLMWGEIPHEYGDLLEHTAAVNRIVYP